MLLNRTNPGGEGGAGLGSGWAALCLVAAFFALAGLMCYGMPPPPGVTAVVSPTSGTGSVTVTLTAIVAGLTAPNTYAWTASPTTTIADADKANASATVTATTIFTVTVTDARGHMVSDSATVTVRVTPMTVVAQAPTTALGCDSIWLTAYVANETPPVSFSWEVIAVGTHGTVTLTEADSQTPVATFSYDAEGDFTFMVTATDARGPASDVVTIDATPTCPCCSGTTFTIANTDDLTGTPGNDVFDGVLFFNAPTGAWLETVNSGDSADGGGGNDTAYIEILGGLTVNPTLTSIETLDLTNVDGAGGPATFDASKTTGAATVIADDCLAPLNVTNLAAIPNMIMTASDQDLSLSFTDTAVSGSSDTLDLTLSFMSGGTFTLPATVENVHIVSSGSTANMLTGLVFTPSTGTTAVRVTIGGDTDLSVGTVANGSPIDASAFTGRLSLVLAQAGTVTGGSGDDTITGSSSADSLSGGDGADVLTGGAGADVINGDAGADTITGGAGNDTKAGGPDADTFVFAHTAVANGEDAITDFTTSDILDFSAFAAGDAPAGTVADTSTGDQAVASNDIWVVTDADGSIDTVAEVAALFGGGGRPFGAAVADMHVVLLIQDNRSGGGTTVWYVDDADSNTTIAAGECARVATLDGFKGVIGDANIAD